MIPNHISTIFIDWFLITKEDFVLIDGSWCKFPLPDIMQRDQLEVSIWSHPLETEKHYVGNGRL